MWFTVNFYLSNKQQLKSKEELRATINQFYLFMLQLFSFSVLFRSIMVVSPNQLQVKRPRALLFDIVGTLAKTSFIDKILLPYIKENVKSFLEENWNSKSVQEDISALRWHAKQDPAAPQIPMSLNSDQAAIIEATVKFVNYCSDKNDESPVMALLRFHLWFDGFKQGRLETPVYSDVANKLKKWHNEGIPKLYVLSNGWAQASRRFLSRTNHGDLNQLIEDHFDTDHGSLDEEATYRKLLEIIKEPAEQVLFLTKDATEGAAAMRAGLNVILVMTHRRNIEKLNEEGKKMPRIRSFNDLELIN